MPHCDRFLFERVLRAHWGRVALARLVIVGNSFAGYHARAIGLKPGVDDAVNAACAFVREVQLPLDSEDDGETSTAFNDVSVHSFPIDAMPTELSMKVKSKKAERQSRPRPRQPPNK
jgi:hypothetical protein